MRKSKLVLSLTPLLLVNLNANDKAAYEEKKVETKEKVVVVKSSRALYNVALQNFRNKNYVKSYEQFNSLFNANMGDILINYYLGRSAYELGKYELALSAYDRILIQQPNNTRVRLEMAQTYMQMKLYTQAISEFNKVLEDKKIPTNVRKTVASKIEYMQNLQKKHFVTATAMAGIMYDSNINATPSTGAFDIYNPTVNSVVTVQNNNKEESSTIYQVVGKLDHTYKYSENFILNSSATALLMKYVNHKEKDVHALSLSVAPTFLEKEYKVALPILFDKINLGHESYQNNFYFNPNYTKILDSSTLYTGGLKLGRINFVDEDDKDANVLELQNSVKYLSDNYGLFGVSLNLGKEMEVKNSRTDVDHKYFDINLSNSYELNNDYTIQTSLNYKQFHYSDTDVNFRTKRKDKKSDITLAVHKPINKEMLVNVASTYSNRDSNHASAEYDKYMLKANFLWNFKVH